MAVLSLRMRGILFIHLASGDGLATNAYCRLPLSWTGVRSVTNGQVIVEDKRNARRRGKRILWFINHSTLRSFEVPLLISLGYEVYTSKLYPRHQRSGSADFSFDDSLSIPPEDLLRLNNHDFYQEPLYPAVRAILNRHFDVAICGFFPDMLAGIAFGFEGLIMLRAFGLAANESYADILRRCHLGGLIDRFGQIGRRFIFAQCYPTIVDAEPTLFGRAKIDLPLGLPDSTYGNRDTWTGGRKEILFFCPGINVAPLYYGVIYREFKSAFGKLPHIIAGEQRIPVDDPTVKGFRPRDEVDSWFRECPVMFYHSLESRHLHYHPLEAIVYGVPLVFMRKGYLGVLDPSQPGACDTISEARRKVERILNGDMQLIDAIKRRQGTLLTSFSWEYCRRAWAERFVPLVTDFSKPEARRHRIAVMLTGPYRGGTLTAAKNIACMLRQGSIECGENAEIVFSCFRGLYQIQDEFADLLQLGITVRETEWNIVTRELATRVLKLDPATPRLKHSDYSAPRDGGSDFLDCDRWLLVGDRTQLPITPYRPYGVVAHDFAQRYVPALFGNWYEHGPIATLRGADYVLVTTPSTLEDAIQYGGVARQRVILAPMDFDPPQISVRDGGYRHIERYIVWPTNSSAHKNQVMTVEALDEFLDSVPSIRKVIVTGVNSQLLSPSIALPSEFSNADHLIKVRAYLQARPRLARRFDFLGEMPRDSFLRTVEGARFLLYSALYDNGSYTVLEAAYLRVPAVSADYPAMRFIEQHFGVPLQFFRSSSSDELVQAMRAVDRDRDAIVERLPSPERLSEFSWRRLAGAYWQIFRDLNQ